LQVTTHIKTDELDRGRERLARQHKLHKGQNFVIGRRWRHVRALWPIQTTMTKSLYMTWRPIMLGQMRQRFTTIRSYEETRSYVIRSTNQCF